MNSTTDESVHPYSILSNRVTAALILIFVYLLVGIVLLCILDTYSFIDSFYTMILMITTQGPTINPTTTVGKILISLLSLISLGVMITAATFIFGPFIGKLLTVGRDDFRREEAKIRLKLK